MDRPLRVLIVKLTAIGDVIHAMPVACALREHMPTATIGWVVEGRVADLLEGHEAVDELFVVQRHWLTSPAAVLDLARRLRRVRWDVALDLQGLTKSAVAAWLSGAKRRIGFAGDLRLDLGRWMNNELFVLTIGREMSRWINNDLVEVTAEHIVDRYLQLLGPLGIDSPGAQFKVPQRRQDVQAVEKVLDDWSLGGGFAVVNPAASKQSKLWSTERFAAVARHLDEAHSLPSVVVWGDDRERGLAEDVVAAGNGHALLAPPTTLTELAALVRRARLFIGCDSGPLHLAAAVGTACIGLFATLPATRNGPYGAQHIAIQKSQLRGTSRQRHRAGNEAMLAIDTETVCQACDQILRRGNQPRRA